MLLAGQVALVVGRGSPIGESIALNLLRAGADVRLAGQASARDQQLADGLQLYDLDVTRSESIERLLDSVGTPDLLVNCAAVSYSSPIITDSVDRWRQAIEVNLVGAFLLLRTIGRDMLRSRRRGSIVMISSTNSTMPVPTYSSYCASKAGLEMLVRVAAVELAPLVRVNGVAPGPVDTNKPLYRAFPGFLEGQRQRHLLDKRLARPDEIAEVVVFLASPAAGWITGQTIVVDGGASLSQGELPKWADDALLSTYT